MKFHHQNGRALPHQAETQGKTTLLKKKSNRSYITLFLSHEAQTQSGAYYGQ